MGNVPVLRFPEFTESWQVKRGGQLFSSRREKGSSDIELYSVTLNNGLQPRALLEKHMHGDAKPEANFVVYPDDIAYNMMRMWQGAMGLADKKGMISPAYVVLKPKKAVSASFYFYLLKSHRYMYYLWAYSYGLTSDRLRLYYKDFAAIPLPHTSEPEQQKIAHFLTTVDTKIQQLQQKQALLQQYKKGVMQQLFSQALRFKDDEGGDYPDWEERRLGDISDCLDNQRIPLNQSNRDKCRGEIPYWGANGILDYIDDFIFDETLVLLAEDGGYFDEFSTRAIASITHGKCWINNHAHVLRAKKESLTNEFLYFQLVHKNILGYINGSTRAKLNKSDMLKIPLILPCMAEQQKIANFLTTIDEKITQTTQQLTAAQTFKKGLLQQMFV